MTSTQADVIAAAAGDAAISAVSAEADVMDTSFDAAASEADDSLLQSHPLGNAAATALHTTDVNTQDVLEQLHAILSTLTQEQIKVSSASIPPPVFSA